MPRLLVTILVWLLAAPATAQDTGIAPRGATEMALAGSGVLAVDDATSLWINPAGLTVGNSVTVSLGLQNTSRSILRSSPDALAEARDLAGIGAADVIMYAPRGKYNSNIYAGAPSPTGALERAVDELARRRGPAFLYLWDPGR